jgi:hypothetical protein
VAAGEIGVSVATGINSVVLKMNAASASTIMGRQLAGVRAGAGNVSMSGAFYAGQTFPLRILLPYRLRFSLYRYLPLFFRAGAPTIITTIAFQTCAVAMEKQGLQSGGDHTAKYG